MAPRLHTIIGSTRPGRVGPSVAAWFHAYAEQHALFKAVLVEQKMAASKRLEELGRWTQMLKERTD
jgi:hypothetical protein